MPNPVGLGQQPRRRLWIGSDQHDPYTELAPDHADRLEQISVVGHDHCKLAPGAKRVHQQMRTEIDVRALLLTVDHPLRVSRGGTPGGFAGALAAPPPRLALEAPVDDLDARGRQRAQVSLLTAMLPWVLWPDPLGSVRLV